MIGEMRNAYLSQEPCDQVTKYNSLVGLIIACWGGDAGNIP